MTRLRRTLSAARRWVALLGTVAALSSHGVAYARDKKVRTKPLKPVVVGARVEVNGGGRLGYKEHDDDALLLGLAATLVPKLRLGDFVLSAPVEISHLEALSSPFDERQLSAALDADYQWSSAVRTSVTLGVSKTEKLDWPDLYQPSASGLVTSDRYSHWDRELGVKVTWHPVRHHWVRAGYQYSLSDYTQDPAFEPVNRPNHLTPLDAEKHFAELSYRYAGRDLTLGVGVDGFLQNSFFVFARDAHTGKTHAGPGGPPANPLQELRGLGPQLEIGYELFHDHLAIELKYRHELQEDTFQGYYSRSGPHPSLEVRYEPARRWTLTAATEMTLLTYGEDAYRLGPGHPALDFGDRRADRKYKAKLEAEWRVRKRVRLTASALYVVRNTNFPDYVPGVFPASTSSAPGYSIDWDYRDFVLMLGVRADNRFM